MERGNEDSSLASSLGEQIRRLRTRRGWSQRRLAETAGIVQQNLSLYERGRATPRLGTLGRLAAALDAEIRLEPRATGAAAAGELAPGLTLPELMDYVDRQVRHTLERERGEVEDEPARDAG